MISPERGSTHEGPMALATAAGTYRMQEYFRLSGSNSGSSVGKSSMRMTFLNPSFSKAVFQRSTPRRIGSRHNSGKASSR